MKKKKKPQATPRHVKSCLCWECYAESERREIDVPIIPETSGFGTGHFAALKLKGRTWPEHVRAPTAEAPA